MGKAQDHNKTFVLIIVIIIFCMSSVLAGDIDIIGNWQGKLILPGSELRIVFKINRDESRQYIATMDSPDQGATGIHVTGVIVKGNEVTLKVGSIRGIFKGTLQEGTGTIEGKWSQSGYEFQLNLKKVDSVSEVKRPQKPQKPFPYQGKEISFTNPLAGITLAGTLTLPIQKSCIRS